MPTIQVLIVDDHDFYRKSLQEVINTQEDIEVIDQACNGVEFLDLLKKRNPDVVLMDVRMPEMDGIEATKKALELNSALRIVGLTFFKEKEYCQLLIKAGVKGILFKNSSIEQIINAIRTVNGGEFFFSEELHDVF